MRNTQPIAAALLLAACLAWCADSRDTITLYVGPGGNDGFTGRLAAATADGTDGPFATISAAQAAVRAVKDQSVPVRVMLRGGVYSLSEPVVFSPEDSGTEDSPVIYSAYPNETPVLSGACTVGDWVERAGGLWVSFLPREIRDQWPFDQVWVDGVRRELKPEPEASSAWGSRGHRHSRPSSRGNGISTTHPRTFTTGRSGARSCPASRSPSP